MYDNIERKMKILIINTGIHEKNNQGLVKMFEYLHRSNTNNSNIKEIEYKIGTIADIQNYDIIYIPSMNINTSLWKTRMILFLLLTFTVAYLFAIFLRNLSQE